MSAIKMSVYELGQKNEENFAPKIYAYEDFSPESKGLLKIGYTSKDVSARVKEQYPIIRPGIPYKIHVSESAVKNDGSYITDHMVRNYLKQRGFKNPAGEWIECSVNDVKSAINSLVNNVTFEDSRTLNFKLRPEQKLAIEKTSRYFKDFQFNNSDKTPHFLWNAKMRFGKTFTAYHLAKEMNWKKILILTFKPAVQSAWEEDLKCHIDFVNWKFTKGSHIENNDTYPLVCFGSFQDFLQKNKVGGIKAKNEWVHGINWDCIFIDEYHYGAWREAAKELIENESEKEFIEQDGLGRDFYTEENMPITTNSYLYLSGTPFRALESGEFIEEQIFNWTYSDEQHAKYNWASENPNPYIDLPRMALFTYQLPDNITKTLDEQYNQEEHSFDLNTLFKADGIEDNAKFIYDNEVQLWLNFIRGTGTNSKIKENIPVPYRDIRLLSRLNHTFWYLPNVSSCFAMKNLLKQNHNFFFHEYAIIVAAGNKAGLGVKALEPVIRSMKNPLKSKTITLSCGKLATGVSVKPWTGIFMLRNLTKPETYFQAAFRVQTPWSIINDDQNNVFSKKIIKEECYIFDFALERALSHVQDYSFKLNINKTNSEEKVDEFIKYLPVIVYDGLSMKQIDASGILDIAMSGTSSTLLAKRWESDLLVHVDNITLSRLLENNDALNALLKLEGFRNIKEQIETIINKSDNVRNLKSAANEDDLAPNQKKQLNDDEKEVISLRKVIKEKLKRFATRIPLFMYLTDYREKQLTDVILKIEPSLFQKVTGLTIEDFEKLLSVKIFNNSLMDDAIFKFKRYEDASLNYTGISKQSNDEIGLFNSTIKVNEVLALNE